MDPTPELTGQILVERARALLPLVRSFADRADAERRLPPELVRALAQAGLFRIAVARSCGGAEADPRAQILAIEAISAADGAAGWTLMIGIECLGMASAMLRPDVAEEVVASHPEVVFSGALNPLGRATAVEGGFRVSASAIATCACCRSASGVDDARGTFSVANATKSSMAARAMPVATPTLLYASRLKFGKRNTGPVSRVRS